MKSSDNKGNVKGTLRTVILTAAGLLLAGCAHQQPGQSEVYRPYAKVFSNKVCITLPHLRSGEKLFSIYISERGNPSGFMMRQYPWKPGKYLAATPGKCIPDFNFPYVIGHGYDVAVQVVDPIIATANGATQGRVYSSAFALWREDKKLHVVPVI